MASVDMSRRELLRGAALLGGIGAEAQRLNAEVSGVAKTSAYRAKVAAIPIEEVKLTNLISVFSGPGGNVIVRHGEFDKILVNSFVLGALPAFKKRLDAMGDAPILYVINTNWLFDNTDNNESFRKWGAEIVAHENAKQRLSEPYDRFGMHFDASPAGAMPTQTFTTYHDVTVEVPPGSEEYVDLAHVPGAHSDSDIYAHFVMGDVLHLGDTFINGMYPFIDVDRGGTIDGMIAGSTHALKGVNPGTKIVPAHGPVADRAALTRYQDMLVTVRDRVQKLKMGGHSETEIVAAKPTADLDATWSQGYVQPDAFVSMVYKTL